MSKCKPVVMQLAEPEYMCPNCGTKFYFWHISERPDRCLNCDAEFDWYKESSTPNPEKEHVRLMRDATQEELENVKRFIDTISKPTGFNFWNTYEHEFSACDNCPNNPKNGGSGICFCTLGTPKITC